VLNRKILLLAFLCVSVLAATPLVSLYYIARPNRVWQPRNVSRVALDVGVPIPPDPNIPIDNPGGG